jgi:hypothetical protein
VETERRIKTQLQILHRKITRRRLDLEAFYRERDDLYEEGVAHGFQQQQLAEWSGSTPGAVWQVLRKRANGG